MSRLGHDPGERCNTLAVKGGLRNAPLAQPELVLTGQEAIAQCHPQLGVERALVVVARVVLQDVTNIGGVGDEEAAPRTDLEVDDVAELAEQRA